MIGSMLRSRYELTGLVADGPIFATYSARDRQTGKDLAVRILKSPFSQDQGFVDRLKAVVAKYRVLSGPNLEPLFDVEQEDGQAFIVGELTRGPSLGDRIRKLAPFSIQLSVATAISICRALQSLHKANVAHGDLNPQNIAVMADGDVRLQLVGIWEAYSASTTAASMILPSMSPYLAPDVSGGAMPSPRSDVYSVGVVLFELLSGRLPYYAETPVAMALRHATHPTPGVRSINPSVPSVLEEIVRKAMSKEPALRYGSATEMLTHLTALQDALRFGRQLNWPIRPAEAVPGAGAAPKTVASKPTAATNKVKATPQPQRVAPRMSAIRSDEEYAVHPNAERERDVPVWMMLVATFLGSFFLVLVGTWMLYNLNQPRTVTVPGLKGLSLSEARAVLSDSKLKMRIARHEPNDRVEVDHILDADPPSGEKTREGSTVSVTISSGSRYVAVPDLRGLTLDKAKTVLASVNLEMDDNLERTGDAEIGEGLVARTNPTARSRVDRESRIHVFVSSGATGTAIASMTPNGKSNHYHLVIHLDSLLKPTDVRVDITDDEGTRMVYEDHHTPGQQIDLDAHGKGDKVVFLIYYDNVLVKKKYAYADGRTTEE